MSYSPVTCYEEADSRKESITLDGITCSVKLRVPYVNRYTLVSDLIANSRLWPHLSVGVAPAVSSCVIMNEGLSSSTAGGEMVYDDALIDVTYSDAQKDLASEEIQPNVEFRTLDHRQFRWSSGDLLLEAEAPGRQIRGLNFIRTWYFVTAIPSEVLTLIGTCNSASVSAPIMGFTFAPETLLYTPPDINRTVSLTGDNLWTVRTQFSYKPSGWNKYWRAKTEAYESIVQYGSGAVYKSFPTANFTPVFSIPQIS